MRGSFHTREGISRLNCWKDIPAIASRPFVANPIDARQSNGKGSQLVGTWRLHVSRHLVHSLATRGGGDPTLRTGDTVECKMIREVMDEVSKYAVCR